MDAKPWIDRYVDRLKADGGITSPAVESAFRRVPRHRLVETFWRLNPDQTPPVQVDHDPLNPKPPDLDVIYSDQVLCTRAVDVGFTSSSSMPPLMAWMLELLDLQPGHRVLEIGAGTGYNAALVAEIVGAHGRVVSVDIQEDVVAQAARLLAGLGYPQVVLRAGDGFFGAPEEAPYDRIVATVGCPDLSPHWVCQLRPEGSILVPLAHGGWNPLVQVRLENGRISGKVMGHSGFMPIQGELATESPFNFTRGLAPTLEDARELPLFAQVSMDQFSSLCYFIAIRDDRVFVSFMPAGYGLYEESRGVVLVRPQEGNVVVGGDESLYDELRDLYIEWLDLGEPLASDFDLEFVPIDDEGAPSHAERTWVVDRKFYRQILTLPGQAIGRKTPDTTQGPALADPCETEVERARRLPNA